MPLMGFTRLLIQLILIIIGMLGLGVGWNAILTGQWVMATLMACIVAMAYTALART